jgi:hypothetical protein
VEEKDEVAAMAKMYYKSQTPFINPDWAGTVATTAFAGTGIGGAGSVVHPFKIGDAADDDKAAFHYLGREIARSMEPTPTPKKKAASVDLNPERELKDVG